MDWKSKERKYQVLISLFHLLTIGHNIVFCQQRHTADRIAQHMVAKAHKARTKIENVI